jgi:hypothetical protein
LHEVQYIDARLNKVLFTITTLNIIWLQGRPLPMGQPGQSEQLAPPRHVKICHTPDHDASTTLRRQSWNVICASRAYFQLSRDLRHHATVLHINVWPGDDRLFGASSKSAPGERAPLTPPKGQHCLVILG